MTLVTLIVSDSWERVKGGAARLTAQLFGRRGSGGAVAAEQRSAEQELDQARTMGDPRTREGLRKRLGRDLEELLVPTAFADRALREERLRIAPLSELLREAVDPFAVVGGPQPLEWLETKRSAVLEVLRAVVRHKLYILYTPAWYLAEAYAVVLLYRRRTESWHQELLELGIEAAEEAAARARTAGELTEAMAGEARLRSLLSRLLVDLGQYDGAREQLQKANARAEASGDLELRASVLEFFGRYLDIVDPPAAIEMYRRSLELNERAGQTRGIALVTFYLGCALGRQGDRRGAIILLYRALEELEHRVEPDLRMAARVRVAIGLIHRDLGETEDAIIQLLAAVAALRAVADDM
ncbi:hypothetical protein ACWEL8_08565 [Streptomyces sp. NPDC004690]